MESRVDAVIRMDSQDWGKISIGFTKPEMDRRLKECVSYRGWEHTIRLIVKSGLTFDKLNVAEVGCGSGTFSLTLAILGAQVTLIDFNKNILEKAKILYELYGCKAKTIEADCLQAPTEDLMGKYDIVISGGLAEHFKGSDRKKIILYHKLLLKENGFAYVAVPNRLSPFYQVVRLFRKITGTWNIAVEIPFSCAELKSIAQKLGFKRHYSLGTASLFKDILVYPRGLISAAIEVSPQPFRNKIRRIKSWYNKKEEFGSNNCSIRDMILSKTKNAGKAKQMINNGLFAKVNNNFSSGIILFAWK